MIPKEAEFDTYGGFLHAAECLKSICVFCLCKRLLCVKATLDREPRRVLARSPQQRPIRSTEYSVEQGSKRHNGATLASCAHPATLRGHAKGPSSKAEHI